MNEEKGDETPRDRTAKPGKNGGKRPAKSDPHTDQSIHAAISRAILQGELKAGAKLPEHRLAEIFGASRERVRKVLHRLAGSLSHRLTSRNDAPVVVVVP